MQWSKAKKRVEALFASSVKERVELRTTHYRKAPDEEGRSWITVDGVEIHDFCTHKFLLEKHRLETGIRDANASTDWRDPDQRDGYYAAGREARDILERRGVVSRDFFETAVEEYPSLSIEEAIQSKNFVHRAFAVLDRRLGKRRLEVLELRTDEHPLVERLYELRCEAEGISSRSVERLR